MATIQTVFGSRAFLTQLQTKQAAPTLLLKPESHGLDYMLLDSTGRGKFTLPFKYNVLATRGELQKKNYVHMMYFNLAADQEAIFVAQMKTFFDAYERFPHITGLTLMRLDAKQIQFVLMSSWISGSDFFALKSTPAFAPLNKFMNRAADQLGFHENGYRVIDPDDDQN